MQQCGLTTGQSFVLELTQQELADLLGLHVIHVSRVLGRLRARKLLSTSGKDSRVARFAGFGGAYAAAEPLRSVGAAAPSR